MHNLSDILGRTAAELALCRDVIARIEDAVHVLLARDPDPAGRAADLQSIDLLDQRVDDLSRWLAALSPLCGDTVLPAAASAALDDLRLEDLRRSLSGQSPDPDARRVTELF